MSQTKVVCRIEGNSILVIPLMGDDKFSPIFFNFKKELKKQGVILKDGKIIPCG